MYWNRVSTAVLKEQRCGPLIRLLTFCTEQWNTGTALPGKYCVKEAGDRNAGWINILIRLGIVFPNLHWAVLASLSSLALIYCSKLTVVPFSVVFSCCDMLQIWQCSTGHLVVTSDSAIIFFFFAPEIHSLWNMTISVNSTDYFSVDKHFHKHWNQPTRH